MPKFMEEWLKSLTDEQAQEIFDYVVSDYGYDRYADGDVRTDIHHITAITHPRIDELDPEQMNKWIEDNLSDKHLQDLKR